MICLDSVAGISSKYCISFTGIISFSVTSILILSVVSLNFSAFISLFIVAALNNLAVAILKSNSNNDLSRAIKTASKLFVEASNIRSYTNAPVNGARLATANLFTLLGETSHASRSRRIWHRGLHRKQVRHNLTKRRRSIP